VLNLFITSDLSTLLVLELFPCSAICSNTKSGVNVDTDAAKL
jgi:hypothetical protein